jgi:hypothetical protein
VHVTEIYDLMQDLESGNIDGNDINDIVKNKPHKRKLDENDEEDGDNQPLMTYRKRSSATRTQTGTTKRTKLSKF